MVKSEVPMPARTRRRYTEEFKREAVRLVRQAVSEGRRA
jgi:transposase-like protein